MKSANLQQAVRVGERGTAALVAIILLAILAILATADFVAVRSLKSDLKLIEKRQIERINGSPPSPGGATNSISHG